MTDQDHAKIVREAFQAIAAEASENMDEDVWRAACNMAVLPDDATLAKLRRMLR